MQEYRGVWVLVEQLGGDPSPVSWELMGAGRRLGADLETGLSAVVLGHRVDGLARLAFEYGADKVYLVDHPLLRDYTTEPYSHALVSLVRKHRPEILILGATTLGRDLAGAVATRLETGLTADCTGLEIDKANRLLKQTRPAFGGNVMATIVCKVRRPQMATVRPRVMAAPERMPGREGQLIREDLHIAEEDVPTKLLRVVREEALAVYLDRAEIIVAGGRGLGSKAGFKLLKELAGTIGGTLGASRPAVEAGWLPPEYQVGQTGITVRPKVYFAIGISGAVQHLVGMQYSDVIVAINSDPQAPIFKVATFGIVGDLFEVVPALTRELSIRVGGPAREAAAGRYGKRAAELRQAVREWPLPHVPTDTP